MLGLGTKTYNPCSPELRRCLNPSVGQPCCFLPSGGKAHLLGTIISFLPLKSVGPTLCLLPLYSVLVCKRGKSRDSLVMVVALIITFLLNHLSSFWNIILWCTSASYKHWLHFCLPHCSFLYISQGYHLYFPERWPSFFHRPLTATLARSFPYL